MSRIHLDLLAALITVLLISSPSLATAQAPGVESVVTDSPALPDLEERPIQGVTRQIDRKKQTITIRVDGAKKDTTYEIYSRAIITVSGVSRPLADVQEGMRVSLYLAVGTTTLVGQLDAARVKAAQPEESSPEAP